MLIRSLAFVGEFTHFALRALPAALGSLFRPGGVLYQMFGVLLGAMPLALVAGVSLGAVIWMHTHEALARTGTEAYLPTMLAAAVLLELAPVGAGLIVAARTGAHLGAELGAMRISEQIDALEMLGVSPLRRLVGPRVLACVVALPLVNIVIATLAIGSGFIAENLVTGTTWLGYESAFLSGPRSELYLADVIPAMLKTLVFGYLIGVAGCYFGLRAEGGTEGVGEAATRGVVSAGLLVLIADVFLVGLIQLFNA